jgi:hypothetical protein
MIFYILTSNGIPKRAIQTTSNGKENQQKHKNMIDFIEKYNLFKNFIRQ